MDQKQKIALPNTTLDFYTYEEDGIEYIEFDARECEPPEPMVNALAALQTIITPKKRLRGTFFHLPEPLLVKVSNFFDYDLITHENGDVTVTFSLKNQL